MRKEGAISATIEATVAFHDIDIVGVMWHGHYLKYLENARWALMNKIGFGFEAMSASGFAWPIVEMHVKYVHAARLNDQLRVRASLVEWENRLAVNYLIVRADGERLARAKSVQVAVDAHSGALQFTTPQPLLDCVKKYGDRFKSVPMRTDEE
jgi:acyl-CoA thioester hydrolase